MISRIQFPIYKLKDNDGSLFIGGVNKVRMLHFVNTFVYWMVIFTGIMFLSVPLSDFTSCFKNRGC